MLAIVLFFAKRTMCQTMACIVLRCSILTHLVMAQFRTPRLDQQDTSGQQQPLLERDWMTLYRDRHRAERAARGKFAAKTEFPWLVCPFLGCVSSLKSEFAVKVRRG